MANTYSAGVVTAYGAAKRGGYTGTYEEFCEEQARFAENAQAVHEDREAVEATVTTFENVTMPHAVQSVTDEGTTQIGLVTAEGTTQISAVNTAGGTQVGLVTAEGTTQIGLVQAEGTTQTGLVTAEGSTQVQAVEDKGEEVIESIPADYTQLSADVDNLKVEMGTKAPVIIDTASGAIASFPDGADAMPIKALTVSIEPVQSGTGDPSPTNIRPISGWTGLSLTRDGENLLNNEDAEIGRAWNGAANTARARLVIPCKPNTTYTLSMNGTNSMLNIYRQVSRVVPASSAGTEITNSFPNTFTTGSDSNFIIIAFSKTNIAQSDVDSLKLQLNLGSTASEYHSGTANETVSVSWQTEAGTVYGGSLNVTTGVLTVDRAKAVIDGTYNWSFYNGGASASLSGYKHGVGYNAISDQYKFAGQNATISAVINSGRGSFGLRYDADLIQLYPVYENINTNELLKAYLTSNPFSIVYPLATPLVAQLDPITISTLYGQNNTFADTGDTTVEYPADTKLYIEKLTAPTEDDMIANSAIESGKYFFVGNRLFLSTAAIANGATLTPGTNCVETNLAEALNALNS